MALNSCTKVKESAEYIVKNSKHVTITNDIEPYATSLIKTLPKTISWQECHFQIKNYTFEEVSRFIFAIDTLNFCFWPHPNFEYSNLTQGIKKLLDLHKLNDLTYMQNITPSNLKEYVFEGLDFVLLEERARMLREVFSILKDGCLEYIKAHHFDAVEVNC